MGANDQLIQVNQKLELAVQQLNELLHFALTSGEQINLIQSINNRMRELENDPDFEKAIPELDRLYAELRRLKGHLNFAMREYLSSEQLEKLQQNIFMLYELNKKLTEATSEAERGEEVIRYAREALAAIAGDPTISPSLIHVIKQSQAKLKEYSDKGREIFNKFPIPNMEIRRDIWENFLRISKAMYLVNKSVGNNPDDIPCDDTENFRQFRSNHPSWNHKNYRFMLEVCYVDLEYQIRQISNWYKDPKRQTWSELTDDRQIPSIPPGNFYSMIYDVDSFLKWAEESRE